MFENELNGDHFVQTVGGNTLVCKVEINSNEAQAWRTFYTPMALHPCYNKNTVEENSDYPGNHIYYLPKIEN